jgi:16S rRNA (guanine527-N7)-methyltransferase
MGNILEANLRNGAAQFGAQLDIKMVRLFFEYKRILLEWNEKMNLTAIRDDREIILKHFVDSLCIIPFLEGVETLIDVGTGAGFPGIPLKIVKPDIDIVLLDSLEKRIGFLDAVTSELNLKAIKAVHMRAEDAGKYPEFREKFDVVTARAVAALPILLEYCLPLVRMGGIFIAMKGCCQDEISISNKALNILGGEIDEVKEFTLPDTDIKRSIVIVRKLRQTPTIYPRKAGKPSREPLV